MTSTIELPDTVEMVDHSTVKLIRHCASDDSVVQAAQVSVKGENNPGTIPKRLIKALMKDRHGSPFEHNSFTWYIEQPLFSAIEQARHRHASINQYSARYSVMPARFYTYPEDRKLAAAATGMRPEMVDGGYSLRQMIAASDRRMAQEAWSEYKRRLEAGASKEVARSVLPTSIMTQMYWTVNARGLMNFLSLRVEDHNAQVVSYPQMEIQKVALAFEEDFKRLMPATHWAFDDGGRVAP